MQFAATGTSTIFSFSPQEIMISIIIDIVVSRRFIILSFLICYNRN
jgi:hypothetical protein